MNLKPRGIGISAGLVVALGGLVAIAIQRQAYTGAALICGGLIVIAVSANLRPRARGRHKWTPPVQPMPLGEAEPLETTPVTGRPPPRRPDVDVTAEYLTSFYKDRLAVQEHKVADSFVGKWMLVSGPIGDVGPWRSDWAQVTLNRPGEVSIYLIFRDQSVVNQLAELKHGDRISVCGQIDRIEFDNVQLDPCDLVEVVVNPVREHLIAVLEMGASIRDQVIDPDDEAEVSAWNKQHEAWQSKTYEWLRHDVNPDDAFFFIDAPEIMVVAEGRRLAETYGSSHAADLARLDIELSNLAVLIDRRK